MTDSSTTAPTVSWTTAWLLILTLLFVRGVNWPVIKIGLDYVPSMWFAVGRMGLAAVTLFAILAWRGELRLPPRHDLPIVFSLGILTVALYLTLAHVSVEFIEAGRAAILAYTTPLWVAPAAMLFLGERPTPLKFLGLFIGVAGVVVLFDPLGFDWSDQNVLIGNGLLLLGALCWAIAIIHIRVHQWEATPLQLIPWQMLVGLAPTVAVAAVLQDPGEIVWGWEFALIIIFNGCIASSWGSWALVTVNRSLPAISTSVAVLGVPAMGLVCSILILAEPVTWPLVIGVCLIFGGVGLVALADQWRRPNTRTA